MECCGEDSGTVRRNRSIKLAENLEHPMVAVVGGDTLLAREVCELLSDVAPAPRLQLVSANAENRAALLTADEETAVLMMPLAAESLEGAKVVVLAGSPASSRRTLKVNPPGGPVMIDLTAALEEQPNARLRAPTAEAEGAPALPHDAIHVIAHPGAIAIATLLARLSNRWDIRRSSFHVFEPASERGQRGLDELRQQVVGVLAFQKLKTDVFDAQLAFNLLARYGEEALEPLGSDRAAPGTASGFPALGLSQDPDAIPAADPGPGLSRAQFLGMGGIRGEPRRKGARERSF